MERTNGRVREDESDENTTPSKSLGIADSFQRDEATGDSANNQRESHDESSPVQSDSSTDSIESEDSDPDRGGVREIVDSGEKGREVFGKSTSLEYCQRHNESVIVKNTEASRRSL